MRIAGSSAVPLWCFRLAVLALLVGIAFEVSATESTAGQARSAALAAADNAGYAARACERLL
jgi:hypothetical protein